MNGILLIVFILPLSVQMKNLEDFIARIHKQLKVSSAIIVKSEHPLNAVIAAPCWKQKCNEFKIKLLRNKNGDFKFVHARPKKTVRFAI